jgi:IS1 family transposase
LLTFKQIQLKIRQEKEKLSKMQKKKAQAGTRSGILTRRFEQAASTIQQHIKRLENQLKSAKKF